MKITVQEDHANLAKEWQVFCKFAVNKNSSLLAVNLASYTWIAIKWPSLWY